MVNMFFRAVVFLIVPYGALACEDMMRDEHEELIGLMDSLAAAEGLEAVYGDRFPAENPYRSFGTPYLLNFSSQSHLGGQEPLLLFLARKKKELHKDDIVHNAEDYLVHYDYSLISAIQEEDSDSFVIQNIIEDVPLMGMYKPLNGWMYVVGRKEFEYIGYDKKDVNNPYAGYFNVFMSGVDSTTILVYYEDSWFRHIEKHSRTLDNRLSQSDHMVAADANAHKTVRIGKYIELHDLMDRIAASLGLEAVHGERFPMIAAYNDNNGSSYVLDFIRDVDASMLFIGRKKNRSYQANYACADLGSVYDYFLIFAVRSKEGKDFTIDVIDQIDLHGMSLFYGELNIDDEKEFSHVSSGRKIAWGEIDQVRMLSIAPVLISTADSTTIIFYYDGSWIYYTHSKW